MIAGLAINLRPALLCSMIVTSMSTNRRPTLSITVTCPVIWVRTWQMMSSYSGPAGFIRPGLATTGSVGPGRGALDLATAIGAADGSGGRLVLTGGITIPGTRIASTAITGIHIGTPATPSDFITMRTSTTVGMATLS